MHPISRKPYDISKQATSTYTNDSTDFQLKDNRGSIQAHMHGISGNKSGELMGTDIWRHQGLSQNNSRQGTQANLNGMYEGGISVPKEVKTRPEFPNRL
jgi:hypothetical protein